MASNVIRWTNVRGVCRSLNPDSLPDGLVPEAVNLELLPGAIGRRRPPLLAIGLSSGPTDPVYSLYGGYRTPSASFAEIWAFTYANPTSSAFRLSSGGWSSVSVPDTPSNFQTDRPQCAALNNKLFIAYNSAVNRLHVWDGTSIRSVGIDKPAALTVADTGAGAYAATARYYRTSQRIKSGSNIIVESELSDAVSFTPSGAGTAARITKSATKDGATHWVVWGLIGTSGDTYDLYEELAEIAVATTTYDDSTAPASYSGDAPAELGLHIPPPSCKFIVADGNRLLMAGAHETSGSSSETTPKTSRVWFTRVLGSSDIGDDETIPNTASQKNWIDVGENDGDLITALAGPINGSFYVFKRFSIYRLVPTNNDVTPFVAVRVSAALGASWPDSDTTRPHRTCIVAEDHAGEPAVYFCRGSYVYRINSEGAIEWVNADWATTVYDATSGVNRLSSSWEAVVYWAARRQLIFAGNSSGRTVMAVFTPELSFRDERGILRGGWSYYECLLAAAGSGGCFAATTYENGSVRYPMVGGANSAAQIAFFHDSNAAAVDMSSGSLAFTTSVTSRPFIVGNQGANNVLVQEPILEAATMINNATPTVSYIRDYGAETRSATAPSLRAITSPTRLGAKIEGLTLSDTRVFQAKITWATDQYSDGASLREQTGALVIPYLVQEPV